MQTSLNTLVLVLDFLEWDVLHSLIEQHALKAQSYEVEFSKAQWICDLLVSDLCCFDGKLCVVFGAFQ